MLTFLSQTIYPPPHLHTIRFSQFCPYDSLPSAYLRHHSSYRIYNLLVQKLFQVKITGIGRMYKSQNRQTETGSDHMKFLHPIPLGKVGFGGLGYLIAMSQIDCNLF